MSAIAKLRAGEAHPLPRIEVITPADAERYLASMVTNRPLSDAKLLEYGIAIEQERWVLNGETIKFNSDGDLFDGQHRLRACILAGKPFRTYVVRGIDDERAFATVDVGKNRSHGDIFGMSGWADGKTVAAVATIIYLYRQGNIGWSGPAAVRHRRSSAVTAKVKRMPTVTSVIQKEELVTFAESIRDELSSATRFAQNSKARRLMPIAPIGALYFLFREKGALDAERFFNDLGEGAGLTNTDPVYALREKLISANKTTSKINRWAVIGLAIKAWNKRRDGEKARVLKIVDGEVFPKIK